jgi:hypothetical protein
MKLPLARRVGGLSGAGGAAWPAPPATLRDRDQHQPVVKRA